MVKTDSYVQFEAGKLTYRVVPVTEEIIRMIVSGKEIKEAQDSLIIEKKEYPEVDFSAEENAGNIIVKTAKSVQRSTLHPAISSGSMQTEASGFPRRNRN